MFGQGDGPRFLGVYERTTGRRARTTIRRGLGPTVGLALSSPLVNSVGDHDVARLTAVLELAPAN